MKIGTAGPMMPPVDTVVRGVERAQQAGYDSVWWADHLMGWSPDSVWTPDIAAIAAVQSSPHVFLDVASVMAVASQHTHRIALGTSVTDAIRRPPPVLAQQFLSLHHLSHGRAVLGVGAGELENVEPYGMTYRHQVSRLEEALHVIRLLWEADGPVSFDGDHWPLRDAVLGLSAYEGSFPPIWLAAHGPRMLELCGRSADGWLPIGLSVNDYSHSLGTIRTAAKRAGRDPESIEAGLFAYCVLAATHERAHELLDATLLRLYALLLPAHVYERHGSSHPLGNGFYGLTAFVPTRMDRSDALRAAAAVPFDVVHEFFAHGTPDDVLRTFRSYEEQGMEHVVAWNLSFLGDLDELRPSFAHLADVVEMNRSGT